MRNRAAIMRCRAGYARQSGIVLITTLVMLVMITLFVVSAIRLSSINLNIVGNYQWQRTMELTADSALEQVISNAGNFGVAATGWDICLDGIAVNTGDCDLTNPLIGNITAPQCAYSATAEGYSENIDETSPFDNSWILTASVSDPLTGAAVRVQRGINLRQLKGNCPG